MTASPRLRRFFSLWLRRPGVREGVALEIGHHIQERVDELIAGGMTSSEAHSEARRQFGDIEGVRDKCQRIDRSRMRRDRGEEIMSSIMQDIRYAFRSLAKPPASVFFAGVAFVASLLPAWRAMRVDPVEALQAE